VGRDKSLFRIKILIIISTAVGLAVPFYLVPNVMGDSFIKSSPGITYLTTYSDCYLGPCGRTFHILRDKQTLTVAGIEFYVQVSNSYFLPVTISYKGPDILLMIYNRSIENPADRRFDTKLVWKTTGSSGLGDDDNTRFTGYAEFAEHVTSVPPSGLRLGGGADLTWDGTIAQTGAPAGPGPYFVYMQVFGRLAPAIVVRVTS
jgi:hypothetical protein